MVIFDKKFSAEDITGHLDTYKVISFDIFDTLIKRSVASLRDVFCITAREFNKDSKAIIDKNDFCQARSEAAAKARGKAAEFGREEITIDDIYQEIRAPYKTESAKLMELEKKAEITCCFPDPVMKKVYQWCIENGKHIYITSDMYLPKNTIEEILSKCGYKKYKKLYLSSDNNAKKYTGHLYQILLEETDCKKGDIVHIGDNPRIDYLQAKKAGISAILIPNRTDRREFVRHKGLNSSYKKQYDKYQVITGSHTNPEWNIYYRYGFEVIGILLYGFCTWLHDEAKRAEHQKLFFLSRDGYLMQSAYNLIFGSDAIDNDYLYVSRKSLRKPQFWIDPKLDDILEQETAYHYWSVEEICDLLDIDINEGKQIWKQSGLGPDERLDKNGLLTDLRINNFYEHFKSNIIQKSKLKFDNVICYLSQQNFQGNVAIVDVGWAGAIQKYLNRIIDHTDELKTSIYGYYLGFKPKTVTGPKAKSYIPHYLYPSLFCSHLMEYPFTKMVGSTLDYKKNAEGLVTPVLDDYEFTGQEDEYITEQIQKGAIRFISLMCSGYTAENCDYSIVYAKLRAVTKSPSLRDVGIFGKLSHVNHGLKYHMAEPKSFFYYVKHPKALKFDLSSCGWKIGFLKSMLKLPLPYNALLLKIRKSDS